MELKQDLEFNHETEMANDDAAKTREKTASASAEGSKKIEEDDAFGDRPREIKIENLEQFRSKAEELSHFKVKRKLMWLEFDHHFVVISLTEGQLAVFHYTSSFRIVLNSISSLGEFKYEKFNIGAGSPCPILDFEKGLYKVVKPEYKQICKRKAYERIFKRANERNYDASINNCEHIVNYILSGESESDQVEKKRMCSDIVTTTITDIKNVGLRVAFAMVVFVSVVASLVRRAYVQVIVAAMVNLHTGGNAMKTCDDFLEKHIIEEIEGRIEYGKDLPNIHEIANASEVIDDLKQKLDDNFVCEAAYQLGYDAFWKVILWCLVSQKRPLLSCFTLTQFSSPCESF